MPLDVKKCPPETHATPFGGTPQTAVNDIAETDAIAGLPGHLDPNKAISGVPADYELPEQGQFGLTALDALTIGPAAQGNPGFRAPPA